MADFNKVLEPGDWQNGLVNTVVEIPEGSNLKVEWDRERAAFVLDRVEPKIFAKPVNYGFIPQTLDEDGDELDTLIVCDTSLTTGIWLEAKVLGVLRFEDDGEIDDKIVVRVADDRQSGGKLNSLEDLGDAWKNQIVHHFTHYKDLKKPGSTKVLGWGDAKEAKKIISQCIDRYSK
ncbi:MAG: inorganic diphosphatase [Patescibacteria group bacterium]|jgi:inorganic pyrophosphatase|nr:inorganic diphosphatase [Patescibacteria group bacterium]